MQGRFSPVVGGKIQSFPWDGWELEFAQAKENNFKIMEWVVEQEKLFDNPVMNVKGRREIKKLMSEFNVKIPSVTLDTFIQNPFYKETGKRFHELVHEFYLTVECCSEIGINKIVVPLVDKGSLENNQQAELLVRGLNTVISMLKRENLCIVFESDFDPSSLSSFIERFDERFFGINYDIGNSASLGFSFKSEMEAYGKRIRNVHVKDRVLYGATVPLGEGNADLFGVLVELNNVGYKGNYILQTARDPKGNHSSVLNKYRDMVSSWLEQTKGILCNPTKK